MNDHPRSDFSLAEWQDVLNDGSLDTFASENNISPKALKLTKGDVIILPNNIIFQDISANYNLFSQSSKNVSKALRDGGLESKIYDDQREKRELILDSADITFPLLLFLSANATSLGLNILSNWIYDKWFKKDILQETTIKVEYLEINDSGKIIRWRKIEGPATEIRGLLLEESQNINKNNQNKFANIINNEKDSWWNSHCHRKAEEATNKANQLIQDAKEATKRNDKNESEKLLRESLIKLREAVLWKPKHLDYMSYLHIIGRKIHDIFGCKLEFIDGKYWIACPVFLSHSKGGFSMGGSGKAICSICGENIFDCEHVKGEIYNNVIAKKFNDICNICGIHDCDHIDERIYNEVNAFAIVTELNPDHVAFVKNPANPLCVILKRSIERDELLKILPDDEKDQFIYGETIIHCHHCLVCNGLT